MHRSKPLVYAAAFLHVETDVNDPTYFILHQTSVIQNAVKALHDYVAHRKAALHAAERRVRGIEGLNHRQQVLLTHALREPSSRYTIEGHRRTHGVAYQTARRDLLDPAKRGFLETDKTKRALVFQAGKDLPRKLGKLASAMKRTRKT